LTSNEIASLNLNSGPPFNAVNVCHRAQTPQPSRSCWHFVDFTAGLSVTRIFTIFEFLKTEV
jgi:hypothetical protein